MAVMWAALPRSGTWARLGDHNMGGSDAPRLHLRSGTASGVMPLGLSATHTAQAAGRRTNPQHDANKARLKERDSENVAVVIATQKGAVRALDRRKKYDPSPPSCSCGAGLSRPRHAQCTSLNSALTSHVARVVAMDPCPRCAVWGRGAVLFLCGVEKRPSLMWRVVVVCGLCARRRAVQIWCGDGPCCGHFT